MQHKHLRHSVQDFLSTNARSIKMTDIDPHGDRIRLGMTMTPSPKPGFDVPQVTGFRRARLVSPQAVVGLRSLTTIQLSGTCELGED